MACGPRHRCHLPLFLALTFFASARPAPAGTTITDGGGGGGEGKLIAFACEHTKHVQMCEAVLSSTRPNSSGTTADLPGLTLLSLDAAAARARDTITRVAEAKKDVDERRPADAFAGQCLDDCLAQYGDAVENLEESRSELLAGSYDTVNAMVSAAMSDSQTCEDGFADRPGYRSPLTERNDHFQNLCSISLALLRLLHD